MILRVRLLLLIVLLLALAFAAAGSLLVVQVRQYALQQASDNTTQTLLMVRQAGTEISENDERWGIWYNQLAASALQLGTTGLIILPDGQAFNTEAQLLPQLPSELAQLAGSVTGPIPQSGTNINSAQGWQWLRLSDGSSLAMRIPTLPARQLTQRLIVLFIVIGLLTLLLAAAGAWWLVGLGLLPLEQMARQAEKLGGDVDELQSRLVVPKPRDEVRSLAESLNRMLGRIATTMQSLQQEEARTRAFAADASHELRTPIAAIQGSLEILERAGDDPTARARLQSNLRRESKRAARLVGDLLTLTRLDAGEALNLQRIDLVALVSEIVDSARDLAPQHMLVQQLPSEPLYCQADRARLEGVIWNLLRNAISASKSEQPITVQLSSSPAELTFWVANYTDLPPEFVPKLFERFSRGPNAKAGGVGLGLAIVRAIVQAHEGRCLAQFDEQQVGVLQVGFVLPRVE